MKTREKPIKLGSLIKELDKWVSLFVRLNAADQNGTVRCISCNDKMFWADGIECQCAHFKDRDNMATRYYLPNLAPSCLNCNVYNHYWHIEQWEKKLTESGKRDLEIRSHSFMKYTRPELDSLILEYKTKVEQLRKLKGL